MKKSGSVRYKSVVAQHLQPIAFGPLGDVVHPWRLVAPQLSARNPADFSLFQHKELLGKKVEKDFFGKSDRHGVF